MSGSRPRLRIRRPTRAASANFAPAVGIGGRSFYTFSSVQPNSEVRITQQFGVLKLTLHGSSYSWELVAENHSWPSTTPGKHDLLGPSRARCPPVAHPHERKRRRRLRLLPAVVGAELERRSCDHELQRLPGYGERRRGAPHPGRKRDELYRQPGHERDDLLLRGERRQLGRGGRRLELSALRPRPPRR